LGVDHLECSSSSSRRERRKYSPMTEHFTRSTVSAAFYCKKCGKVTQHRIDHGPTGAGRKGPCLDCIARLEAQHVAALKSPVVRQRALFGEDT
jgi:hypothetical protein